MKIQTKISLLGISLAILSASMVLSVFIWHMFQLQTQVEHEAERQLRAEMVPMTKTMYQLCESMYEASKVQRQHALTIMQQVVQHQGELTLGQKRFSLDAYNMAGEVRNIELPELLLGGKALHLNRDPNEPTAVVDQTKALTGYDVSIMQRMNQAGDMVRVATTVVKNDTRQVGAFIPGKSKFVQSILAGETAVGLTRVGDYVFVSTALPLYDGGGNIVGLYGIGIRQDLMENLRKAMMTTPIGKSGYVWILGSKGNMKGRYILSHNGERDGEVIWDARTKDGSYPARESINKILSVPPGKITWHTYEWQNPDDADYRKKISAAVYFEPWDWIVGVSAYYDDYITIAQRIGSSLNLATYQVIATGIVVLLISVAACMLLTKQIMRPIVFLRHTINEYTDLMKAPGKQAIHVPINIKLNMDSGDELGLLAYSFNQMVDILGQRNEEIEKYINELSDFNVKLEKSEKKYRSIFENASEGIFQSTIEGKFISVNPAFAHLFGYNHPQEVIENVTDIAQQCYANPEERAEINKITTEKIHFIDNEHQFKRRDGSLFWGSASVRTVRDAEGRHVHYEGTIIDITERKVKEDAIKERKAAELANKAKSEFLANMSHEIRTPLNAVTGFSELLTSLVEDEKQKSYLAAIKSAGKSLLTLISDILDLSKIEAGRLEIQYALVDIKVIVKEIEQIFAMKTSRENLDFIVDIDEAVPAALRLDEIRLRQILLNIVGNAVKFTEKGWIKLSVKKTGGQNEENACDLHITIEDTGMGIPEDDLDTIFDSFKQQTGHDTARFGGTGLGLAICKSLIEMMNGQISVESVIGKGSVFKILFSNVEIASEEVAVIEEGFNLENFSFEAGKVLVVDDVKSNRDLLYELLIKINLKVVTAENGHEAIVISPEFQPDIILMDIRMPVMDGLEATKRLRDNEKTRKIPIIAVTASSVAMNQNDILKKGFDGFLSKPVKINKLVSELSQYLTVAVEEGNVKDDIEIETPVFTNDAPAESLSVHPQLLSTLETEFMQKWEGFQERQPIEDVKNFGTDLKDLGLEYNLNLLSEYGDRLIIHVDNFDVINMQQSISEFPDLLSILKASA